MSDDTQRDPLIGQTLLDKLKVLRLLGGGGMGSVYEVEHLYTSHRRALKLIRPEYVRRRNYMKRLVREASVAGKLQTPYVVETYDAGIMEDGSAYVLMELLHGQLLIDLLEQQDVLPVPRLVGIMAQLCEGVAMAHAAGIIHRDLKPENVFLVEHPTGHERVKILDFGISKFRDAGDETTRLTAEGTILGTPFYMSPEQASAQEVDERTDVYAVGVMLYEALTGRLPFDAKSVGALFIKIAAGEYVPLRHFRPDVDPEFAEVVERAMARRREDRFQTMEALRTALLPWAPSDLRVRTKTISDSPKPLRGTVGYAAGIPAAEHEPSSDTVRMGVAPEHAPSEPPAPREEPVAPAAARPERRSALVRQLPWILGLVAAIALGSVLLLSGEEPEDAPAAPGEVAEPPPAADRAQESAAGLGAEADEPEPAEASDDPDEEQTAEGSAGAEQTAAGQEPPTPTAEGQAATTDEGRGPPRRPIQRRPDPDPTPAQEAGLEANPYGMR